MCPCQSHKNFEECCGVYINGSQWPATAEALMRSRYTAFTLGDVSYIKKTVGGQAAREFDEAEVRKWSKESQWLGLEILKTVKGTATDTTGSVEFVAKYKSKNQTLEHHEVSQFKKDLNGHWVFVDGDSHIHEEGQGHQHHHAPPQQVIRDTPKIGRNDPCPCGSGNKYKKCCGQQ